MHRKMGFSRPFLKLFKSPHPDNEKVNRLIINLLAFLILKFAQHLHNIFPLFKSL